MRDAGIEEEAEEDRRRSNRNGEATFGIEAAAGGGAVEDRGSNVGKGYPIGRGESSTREVVT
jgi:hypothetical protein